MRLVLSVSFILLLLVLLVADFRYWLALALSGMDVIVLFALLLLAMRLK